MLRARLEKLPEGEWAPYREDAGAVLECAEVSDYDGAPERLADRPLRWLAIRVRRRQGELFGDGRAVKYRAVKYFAVVSNIWQWDARRLLAWRREKAGSIEAPHHVLKNELAAGVLPCGRFGANAAWLRLALLTHNLLEAIKRLALPPE